MFGLFLMNLSRDDNLVSDLLQIGIPVEQMAKLDANENLHPVPEEMMVGCRSSFTCIELANQVTIA